MRWPRRTVMIGISAAVAAIGLVAAIIAALLPGPDPPVNPQGRLRKFPASCCPHSPASRCRRSARGRGRVGGDRACLGAQQGTGGVMCTRPGSNVVGWGYGLTRQVSMAWALPPGRSITRAWGPAVPVRRGRCAVES
jgi:hypothetical protein